ncbi:MAG: Clp protease N-terminal domain-containing protein, partial [Bacteroidota bacterium]
MNIQKFTLKSQEALQTAQEIAHGYGNQSIEPVHLLAALIQDASGIVPPMLMKIGANVNFLKIKLNEQMGSLPTVSGSTGNYVSQDL